MLHGVRSGIAIAGVLLATACLALPIPSTEILAPSLVGHVEQRDGTPVAGLQLTVSRSESCRSPIASGVTDSTGHFQLAVAPKHRRWTIIPLSEFGVRPYWVCTSDGDSLRAVFGGRIPLQARGPLLDSLQCRTYAPGGDPNRLACADWPVRY